MTGMKRPVHPGKILAEELDHRGIDTGELATQTGIDGDILANIIACNSRITPEIAALLEVKLGIESTFWSNLQTHYDQALSAVVTNENNTK